jgi:hypothetical protein
VDDEAKWPELLVVFRNIIGAMTDKINGTLMIL